MRHRLRGGCGASPRDGRTGRHARRLGGVPDSVAAPSMTADLRDPRAGASSTRSSPSRARSWRRVSDDLTPDGRVRSTALLARRQAAAAGLRLLGLARRRRRRDLDEAALRAAASLEFLQACALIHDDVMDGSDTRRGLPAGAPALRRRCTAAPSGSAPPRASASGAAILLGDLCLSWADEVLLTSGLAATTRSRRGKAVYDEMRTELMAGQYLDLLEQARGGGSVDARPARRAATSRPSTRSSGRCTSAPRSPAPAPTLARRLHRLRPAAGRGVPAARRHPRRLRRPGGDRQARRRRPARGQAHGARRHRRRAQHARRRPRSCAATSATRRSTPTAWRRLREIITDTGALRPHRGPHRRAPARPPLARRWTRPTLDAAGPRASSTGLAVAATTSGRA